MKTMKTKPRKALQAPQIAADAFDEARPCLNPRSVLWPVQDAPTPSGEAFRRASRRIKARWDELPVIILNPDYQR